MTDSETKNQSNEQLLNEQLLNEPIIKPIDKPKRNKPRANKKIKEPPKGEPGPNQLYEVIDGIKVYQGNSQASIDRYKHNIQMFKDLYGDNEPLFTPLEQSMLTARGKISGIIFMEAELIKILPEPTGQIVNICCNYGELFNPNFPIKKPVKKTATKKGRKPKVKPKSKRKMQGNGKYFSSQITFVIEHPESKMRYKIKLFRNGVFQIPGLRRPSMRDIIQPITILRDYLKNALTNTPNCTGEISVVYIVAVLRNYIASLRNTNYHIDIERLEEILTMYKTSTSKDLLGYKIDPIMDKNNGLNSMGIAEMVYNTDRCFSLIVKFNRISPFDVEKQTTVKLLKKGKANWDGGNSELEVEELYYWLQYIYLKYKDEILFDVNVIEADDENTDSEAPSIYDEELVEI